MSRIPICKCGYERMVNHLKSSVGLKFVGTIAFRILNRCSAGTEGRFSLSISIRNFFTQCLLYAFSILFNLSSSLMNFGNFSKELGTSNFSRRKKGYNASDSNEQR